MSNIIPGLTAKDAAKEALQVQEIIQSGLITEEGVEYINKLANLVEDHGNGYLISRTSGSRIDMHLVKAMDVALKNAFGENLTAQFMAMEIRTCLRALSQSKQPSGSLHIFVNSLISELQ